MARVAWNDAALGRVTGKSPQSVAAVEKATSEIAARANSMGSGFKTKLLRHGRPVKGGTSPSYVADVEVKTNAAVGIVYTGNYAAMRDNAKNNTLLKSLGG